MISRGRENLIPTLVIGPRWGNHLSAWRLGRPKIGWSCLAGFGLHRQLFDYQKLQGPFDVNQVSDQKKIGMT